jgi:hypothetical protein
MNELRSKRIGIGLMVGIASLAASDMGCGADVSTADSVGETNEALYSYTGDAKSTTWPTHVIPVCWAQATFDNASYAQFRTDAQNIIENNYGRVSDLTFPGWGRCPNNPGAQIRITIVPGDPAGGTDSGYLGAGVPTDMHVGDKAGDIMEVMLHEFAHALGFDHEIDRPDAVNPCVANPITHAGTSYTPYDNLSITNTTYGNCVVRHDLSPWDVVGMQRVYGRKPVGSLVGTNNKCADIANPGGGQPSGATHIQGWDCLNNNNQSWTYEKTHRFHAAAFTYGYLDVQWGSSNDGTPIWNWTDNPGPAQTWEMQSVQIVGMGDLCLEVPNNNWANGQTLQLNTCSPTSAAQRWSIVDSGSTGAGVFAIRGRSPSGTNWCVSVNNQQGATLTSCLSGGASQSLLLHNGHFSTSAGNCLDVQWGNPAPGTLVWGYSCNWASNAEAQQWKIRGAVHGLSGKCLDIDKNGGVHDGSAVQLWSCLGTVNQTWEYYF